MKKKDHTGEETAVCMDDPGFRATRVLRGPETKYDAMACVWRLWMLWVSRVLTCTRRCLVNAGKTPVAH